MKRRVEDSKKHTFNNHIKLIAVLSALSMSLNAGSVLADSNVDTNDITYSEIENNSDYYNMNDVYKSIYQRQMNYLVPTIEKLKDFYNEEDTKDIIKNGYPDAYNIINEDLNYYVTYNGVGNEYYSNNPDLLKEIKRIDRIIKGLSIKSSGSAREPEYGIIKDNSTDIGFRQKTDEDKVLIDKYTNLLGERFNVDYTLFNIIDKVNNNDIDNIEFDLLNSLRNIYNNQMMTIYKTRTKLEYFYNNIDDKNIIKNAYPNAYESFNKDLNYYLISNGVKDSYSFIDKDIADNNMSEREQIDKYFELINRNNLILTNFKIKPLGNGRDPEYKMIKDNSTEIGFRQKTDEDKALIDNYTLLVGDINYIDYPVVNLLNYVSNQMLTNDKTL